MIVVEQVAAYDLLHPDTAVQYTFRPRGDEVTIVHLTGRNHTEYSVSTQEARELWKRLIRKGYERF